MSLEANSPTVRRIHAESDSRRSAAEVAIALSPGILGIKHIASMLGLKKVLSPREARKLRWNTPVGAFYPFGSWKTVGLEPVLREPIPEEVIRFW